jgi:glutathione S-transferase
MADLALYHAAPSRSSTVLWLLEEIGEPYELRVLRLDRGEHKEAGYLALNPLGKVPTLVHGQAVVTETSAICCYLAERFPAAGLEVPAGDPQRGAYLRWLFFAPGVLEPALTDRMFERGPAPAQTLSYGEFGGLMEVLARAVEPGPHLLGARFTAADVLIGSALRWGMHTRAVPERPELKAYVGRLQARPALQRAQARDRELQARPAAS